VQGEENTIGLRIFKDHMNNLQIFKLTSQINLSMTLGLFLIEHPQVQDASTPLTASMNSSTAIGYF
jgi:hypothetical protein